jgi:hypothetical protein
MSVPSSQCCCEPKTALKTSSFLSPLPGLEHFTCY